MIASAIQQAQRQTTRASATILEVGVAATAHVRVAEHPVIEAEQLPDGCTVETWGAEDNAWVVFFIDYAASVEVELGPDGGKCLAIVQSLASIHFQAMGEREEGEEPLLSRKKVTDWVPQQDLSLIHI